MNMRRFLNHGIGLVILLGLIFSLGAPVNAAQKSPFVGNWVATDVDGSDMTLSIGGPVNGPFKITWTDEYINFCDGSAGILRGNATLNTEDANKLEADLHLQCFTTGAVLEFHVTMTYHPLTNTLSIFYFFGEVTIWHRPGPPQAPPPGLGLRVNYGDDWVESFYEAGHTAWVVVRDAEGNLKGSAEVMTESKDFWPPDQTGFQTTREGWDDGNGDPMESPPDILPYDWVYGWIDNGASAAVQIGEINGEIDLAADTISGTILAPWIEDQVVVECLDWGSGNDPPLNNIDFGLLSPNGEDEYACSWGEDWDILLGQAVGVGYSTPDGHWVANAIRAVPTIHASVEGDWFWVADFYPGTLEWAIYASADLSADPLASGEYPEYQGDLVSFSPEDHGVDMQVGNTIVVSDGVNQKDLVLQHVTMTVFDVEADYMEGTAPEGEVVWAMAGPMEWQYPIKATLSSGPEPGRVTWSADFRFVGFDITEVMREWSFAAIYDGDWDASETISLPPPPSP